MFRPKMSIMKFLKFISYKETAVFAITIIIISSSSSSSRTASVV
jgi:hypothetical protein